MGTFYTELINKINTTEKQVNTIITNSKNVMTGDIGGVQGNVQIGDNINFDK